MTWESLFVWENLKFLLREFQFEMSLKIWQSMTYSLPCSYTNGVINMVPQQLLRQIDV